ncbi:unnamed protein product [Oppiella nova]|uniref:Caspase family p20 domain-containing protein n=1 Tax=Oppiella nova TaxID=334625 RepID=A0A7R9M2J5_9ACAR|nr:unnamed protein product [Oppiella nova]CAG2169581.1 unnamed protein product [Oppiella nova]
MDGTTRTFICYACADGTESFYTGNGYTLYGQALSHCIAEYAYDLNLTQIFNKTCDEMSRAIIQQRPELIMKNVDRELIFFAYKLQPTMDKSEVRNIFMQNINEFLSQAIPADNEYAKKSFIFTEFNRDREACNELVEILKKCDQGVAAEALKGYNQSPTDAITYSTEVKLVVKDAQTLRSGAARWFVMDSAPRGRVLLFSQLPELKNEVDRFSDLFQQMYFSVDVHNDVKCEQIMATLKATAAEEFKKDAMIVMFIGHGYDDMIQGSGEGQNVMLIKTIVEQFSDRNCHPTLRQKPKVFVFNCCRDKKHNALDNRQNSIERDWMDDITRTYICYSCAEGIQAFYTDSGYTLFGQAFSHCIAEHACDFSLTQLFYKTCAQLQRAEVQQRPEMYTKNIDRDLYFNPGLYKEK